MKRGWSLVVLLVIGVQGFAQQPAPAWTGPGLPELAPGEPFDTRHECLAFDGTGECQDSGWLTGNHNYPNFINFISNPLQNIDPRAVTAIYPIFGSAWVNNAGPIPDGNFQFYGPAITIALSERLAVGINQGGYATAQFDRFDAVRLQRLRKRLGRFGGPDFGGDRQGFLNLGGFVQYTMIEDVPNQFLLTGGVRWMAPCGSHEIFQGHGPLELAPYVTAGKELGLFHVLSTVGYYFPAGPGSDNVQMFYGSLHLDRQVCCWFYPVAELNWAYHVRSVEFGLPTRTGFIDMGNFESSGNILTLAVGANLVLVPERLELGAVYSTPLATQRDFDFNAVTVKMVLRY